MHLLKEDGNLKDNCDQGINETLTLNVEMHLHDLNPTSISVLLLSEKRMTNSHPMLELCWRILSPFNKHPSPTSFIENSTKFALCNDRTGTPSGLVPLTSPRFSQYKSIGLFERQHQFSFGSLCCNNTSLIQHEVPNTNIHWARFSPRDGTQCTQPG